MNNKILSFIQLLDVVTSKTLEDGVPAAAIMLALESKTNEMSALANRQSQQEYKEANSARQTGEPITEEIQHEGEEM